MKIAVFHNFMDNIGGAERVALTLARELKADIYTTNIDKEKIVKMGFSDINIYSIGKVPLNAPFRQQSALYKFRKLDLKGKYDFFIIAGDWAMSGAVNNYPNLWYVHSPTREIWDLNKYVRQNMVPFGARSIFDVWTILNRRLNKRYINYVDNIICNSENTKNRVEKFLNKKSIVINPPTDTKRYTYKKSKKYWLSVNRLISHKRVDLQLKAFSKLPDERLIIVGSYEQSKHFKKYAKYCNKIKPKNVQIISWVNQDKLVELYSNCGGFITTSKDEDFGMNVVEAMASGKPVIAPNEGGYKETINKKTGILIDNINEEKLIEAVNSINKELKDNPNKYNKECIKQAKKFDTSIFIKKIREEINNIKKQQKNYKWLLVQGCPRSGTTILNRILNTNPELALTFEEDLTKLNLKNKKEYNNYYKNLFSMSKDLCKVSYFGDKLPEYYNINLSKLKYKLRGFKTIHISRNPLYAINSMTARKRNAELGEDLNWNKYLSIKDACASWINAWNHAVKRRNDLNFLHIKYEDFIENPKRELNKIASFLNIKSNFDIKNIFNKKDEIIMNRKEIDEVNLYLFDSIRNWNLPLEELYKKIPKINKIPFSRAVKKAKDFIYHISRKVK